MAWSSKIKRTNNAGNQWGKIPTDTVDFPFLVLFRVFIEETSVCLIQAMDTKKKSRKLGDLKLHTTFELHFGDKFYPSFDKNSFQRTSLEQHSYRVSNMPFHSNGHTGIFLSKKSIKAGTSLTEQEAEKETKLVNVNYMYILYKNCHSLAS